MPINLDVIDCSSIVEKQTNANQPKENHVYTQDVLDEGFDMPTVSTQQALDKASNLPRVSTLPALNKTSDTFTVSTQYDQQASNLPRVSTLPAFNKTSDTSTVSTQHDQQASNLPTQAIFVPIKSQTKINKPKQKEQSKIQLKQHQKQDERGYRPLEYSIEEMFKFAEKRMFPERIYIIGNVTYMFLNKFKNFKF